MGETLVDELDEFGSWSIELAVLAAWILGFGFWELWGMRSGERRALFYRSYFFVLRGFTVLFTVRWKW